MSRLFTQANANRFILFSVLSLAAIVSQLIHFHYEEIVLEFIREGKTEQVDSNNTADIVEDEQKLRRDHPKTNTSTTVNQNGINVSKQDTHIAKTAELESPTKLILFWSQRPENDIIRPYDRAKSGSEHFQECDWSKCELSRDRERVRDATVLVYRQYDPFPTWPTVRFANQTYVHMLADRPGFQWWLPKFDKKINLTWNYRRDADIPSHVIVVKKENAKETKYVPRVPLLTRTKSVVWAVSHCDVESKRQQYVEELSKHIDVDIYGKCGTLICPRTEYRQCFERWQREYKFYLSFENSICKDYITEKFYRPLGTELIPIVLGGGDYRAAGPPHSFIDIRDYRSPKALATYLHHLAVNEDEYNEYFQWKNAYDFALSVDRMCKLCEIAHNMEKWARPAHQNYSGWWTSACDNNFIDRMRAEGHW